MIQDSNQILQEIGDVIQNSRSGFGKSKIVDGEALQSLLADLEIQLQEDYKQSNLVASNRESILTNARKQADKIVQDAKERADQLTNENEITVDARQRAAEILNNAKAQAVRIVKDAKNESEKLRKETENDLKSKKKLTKEFISDNIQFADNYLQESVEQLNKYSNSISRILSELRELYNGLNDIESFDNEYEPDNTNTPQEDYSDDYANYPDDEN